MQLLDRNTLIDRMINAVRAQTSAITYFGPGPFRAFLYAVAAELQHLYYKLFQVEQRLDLLSATGDSLDTYGSGRGLDRRGASASSVIMTLEADAVVAGTGTVSSANGTTVSITGGSFASQATVGDILIIGTPTSATRAAVTSVGEQLVVASPGVGTITNQLFYLQKTAVTIPATPTPLQFATSGGLTFQAVEPVTLVPVRSGSSILRGLVQARSVGTGANQNVSARAIRSIVNPAVIPFVTVQAINEAAAQGGADQESDATYRTRIIGLFAGLNQGTPAFYEAQVRTINPRVVRVFLGRGGATNEVLVYCATSDGSNLTVQEKLSLATGLSEVVPVQTVVTIRDMVLQPVNVSFTTSLSAGATTASVADALAVIYREFLDWSTWPFGQAVQADDLLRLASAAPGVDSLTLDTFRPGLDVLMPPATLPRVGTIVVQDASTGASATVTGVFQRYPKL